jgi:hypothetical protein
VIGGVVMMWVGAMVPVAVEALAKTATSATELSCFAVDT